MAEITYMPLVEGDVPYIEVERLATTSVANAQTGKIEQKNRAVYAVKYSGVFSSIEKTHCVTAQG